MEKQYAGTVEVQFLMKVVSQPAQQEDSIARCVASSNILLIAVCQNNAQNNVVHQHRQIYNKNEETINNKE